MQQTPEDPATLNEKDEVLPKPGSEATLNEKDEVLPKPYHWLYPLITWICRVLVGGTFVYSGIVKAIDPWGTVYKFHDYLAAMPDGLFSWAGPILTFGAFALFTVEFVVGVCILIGCYRRIAPVGALLLMLVMLPLTLWIALTDPVADCGCFGDALVISNWATFWKNVVLTVLSVWLVIFNKRARCLVLPALQWLVAVASVALCVVVGFIGYSTQPMVDFRPYPVGSALIDAAHTDESDGWQATWTDGQTTVTIPADSIPEGDQWEFVDRVEPDTPAEAPSQEETKGLAIFDTDGEDVTDQVLEGSGEEMLVFMYDLPEVSTSTFYKLNSLYAYCQAHDIPMLAVAAATPTEISEFTGHSLAEYPIYTAEDTAIKEVVRGNPAAVYLKDGKIVWKAALGSVPTLDFVEDTPDAPGALGRYAPPFNSHSFNTFMLIYVAFLALLILLCHVPKVISYSARRIRKNRYVKEGTVVRICTALLLAGSTLLVSCSKRDEPEPEPEKPALRTILVYMVATNSLRYDAPDDLQEILDGYATLTDPRINVLVYKAVPDEDYPSLVQVTRAKNGAAPEYKTLKTYTDGLSSLTKARMQEVMTDMKALAPAGDYGLFLWSHASGWLPATLAPEEPAAPTGAPRTRGPVQYAYGDDFGKGMNVTTLAEAIPRNTFSFIWMDCCYMGSVEVAYQLRRHCDTYVAYPTEVLSGGCPYDLVLPLLAAPEIDFRAAADIFFDYYAENPDIRYRSATVSITDMHRLPDLARACRDVIRASADPDLLYGGLQTYGRLSRVTFYDLRQGYSSLAPDTEASRSLATLWDSVVTYRRATPYFLSNYINPEYYSGLSVNMPGASLNASQMDYYRTLDWYRDVIN